jgi:hypothetical protein
MMNEAEILTWPVSAWVDLVQAGAIIVGGLWAYMLFVRGRQKYPRASLTHQIMHKPLNEEKGLLRVKTQISNPGVIVLRMTHARVEVQQVLPLGAELESLEEEDFSNPERREIPWPLISSRSSEWQRKEFEIEPGEADEVIWDFLLPREIETIAVYSYFRNVKKRFRDIGWGLTTLYDFKEEGALGEVGAKALTGKGH